MPGPEIFPSARCRAQRSEGFTLIELLIVVAIIAILAAIAVPNFLEAQTRSKVSRAKTDMRSLATALEAYRVDNQAYPRAHAGAAGPSFTVDSTYRTINPRIQRLVPLTTPVAYITGVPTDVFNQEEGTTVDTPSVRVFLYADRKSYQEHVPNPYGPGANGANIYRIMFGIQYPSSEWLLRSRGPLGGVGEGSAVGNSVDARDQYDPTNGSVSAGNLFFLGPGIGPL